MEDAARWNTKGILPGLSFVDLDSGTSPNQSLSHPSSGSAIPYYALILSVCRGLGCKSRSRLQFLESLNPHSPDSSHSPNSMAFMISERKPRFKLPSFIEAGNLLEAVNYARTELNKFFSVNPLNNLLEDVVALLAYENPSKSCVAHLLEPQQREFVADAVNAMVLTTNPDVKNNKECEISSLEKLLKQLTRCSLERRSLTGDQGEAFDVRKLAENVSCR
ncbi:hypothetical protein KSP40_PGU020513 [Platanthera guangdongensis]|uniref:CRA domain-containing protein n=1 Tax=Platanthera guangdongensis TaxID=2320717 RepID=A0ABR2MLR5_9ASPA